MCCDRIGSILPEAGVCKDCGEPVDKDGDSLEVCGFSKVECDTCGYAPCDESC